MPGERKFYAYTVRPNGGCFYRKSLSEVMHRPGNCRWVVVATPLDAYGRALGPFEEAALPAPPVQQEKTMSLKFEGFDLQPEKTFGELFAGEIFSIVGEAYPMMRVSVPGCEPPATTTQARTWAVYLTTGLVRVLNFNTPVVPIQATLKKDPG